MCAVMRYAELNVMIFIPCKTRPPVFIRLSAQVVRQDYELSFLSLHTFRINPSVSSADDAQTQLHHSQTYRLSLLLNRLGE